MSNMSPNLSALGVGNPGSIARVFQHRREWPLLPDGYDWETQKKTYSPRDLLLDPFAEKSLRSKFGLVFCHRGLYERASRIVENSFAAIDNGISQGLFLHEIDGFVPEKLNTAVVAHDKIARRVTHHDKPWAHITVHQRQMTALVTRNIERPILDPRKPDQPTKAGQPGIFGPPDLASSYLDTNEKVLALFDVLWRERFEHKGHTIQYDLRDNDLANAIPYYSFHISKLSPDNRANPTTVRQPLVHSMFQSVMLKGYNVVYKSFDHLVTMIEAASCAQYQYNYFERKHLPLFPAMVMVFHAQPIIDIAMETKPTNANWDKTSYEHIREIAMKQIMSYVGIGGGDKPYNFILEITHSGLGLGYNRKTNEARNPLNGKLLKDRNVIFESKVDRVLIDIALELRRRYPDLLFSSCTRLPDYIVDNQNYKGNWKTSRFEAWKDANTDESGISGALRDIHGGLYPQSDIVVADDPTAEIAARTWIDQEFGLDRHELLNGVPYYDWLETAPGRVDLLHPEHRKKLVKAVEKLNASFKANTYGGIVPDVAPSLSRPNIANNSDVPHEGIKQWLAQLITDSQGANEGQEADHNLTTGEEGEVRDNRNMRDDQDEQIAFAIQVEGRQGLLFDFPGDATSALSKLRKQESSDHTTAVAALEPITTITVGSAKFKFVSKRASGQPRFTKSQQEAFDGNEKLLEELFADSQSPLFTPKQCATELGIACEQGHLAVIDMLLRHKANVNVAGLNGLPLVLACAKGRIDVVRRLLDHGGDVNLAEKFGDLPLDVACRNGHKSIVKLLLSEGADPKKRPSRCSMAQAASNGHTDIVRTLLDHQIRRQKAGSVAEIAKAALYDACLDDQSTIVELLLRKGADVNLDGGPMGTPLHAACYQGNMKTINILLENKATVDLVKMGKTALELACARGHYAVAELLLDRGANFKASEKQASGPLKEAYKAGNTSIAKLLLARGATMDFTVDGWSRNTEVASLLLPTWRPDQPRTRPLGVHSYRLKQPEIETPVQNPRKQQPNCGCLICWMDAHVYPNPPPGHRAYNKHHKRFMRPTLNPAISRKAAIKSTLPAGEYDSLFDRLSNTP